MPAAEVLQALDDDQALDGLPFMPEMVPFCGKRFRVARRAERTCGQPPSPTLRRLDGAVLLEGLRCDGSQHGGCQLGCMLIWKEAWLRTVPDGHHEMVSAVSSPAPSLRVTSRLDPKLYFCQATALPKATTAGDPLWKPGQYLRLLRVRTLSLPQLLRLFVKAGRRKAARRFRPDLGDRSALGDEREAPLALQPGEWVEVRSEAEIRRTLDGQQMCGGIMFNDLMFEECGRRMRVQSRVERVIDETTGRLCLVRDTVILEGSVCDKYFGCARLIPFQWQEAWLKRVGSAPTIDGSSRRIVGERQ